ncbi:PREDICTED: LOW QUALITY PROTEIN: olfactory receptor 5B3-like [Ceratotherium simum simum]|uniref:LOW QUALITY PROTEIN: olfactory receptor 5B3-like n=1 Tax=Ceratotherium simum simum TaxID=73337 RepID=A0ABM1D9X1_CERSS|nr:PREDICTED: LOW QUALITY PROTEIN: olfactory receptor 5B3-like [Ceratotherium simum simum]
MDNRTEATQFILIRLINISELQIPFCIMFTLIYLTNMVGNLGIILLILMDSYLHTPIYYFLCNLSLVDSCYSLAVTPTVMAGFITVDRVISYNAHASQMFFFAAFATMENFFLASMAYDCYAAGCKHLHYTTTMRTSVCARLITGCYVCGFLSASIHIGNTFRLSFCLSNVVHHFFCDVPAVMALSCSDTHVSELVLVYVASFNVFFALLIILISYAFIFITILKMHSYEEYQKALSSCASHVTAVSIFYAAVVIMYLQPSSSHSMDTDKTASVFYTMILPMQNPVVYSLRNKEVKRAFMKGLLEVKLSLGLGF